MISRSTGTRLVLILQKSSMLKDRKMFRSIMVHSGALIHATRLAFVVVLGEGGFICLLRSDWVIPQLVRQNRLDNRTSCNSFSPDFHVSGTFERHVTLLVRQPKAVFPLHQNILYSRTPLIRPPSESHWCGRIRGMVARERFVYEQKPLSVTRNVVV